MVGCRWGWKSIRGVAGSGNIQEHKLTLWGQAATDVQYRGLTASENFLDLFHADWAQPEETDGIRLTWNLWPNSKLEATKCVIPFAALYSPNKRLPNMPVGVESAASSLPIM